jgi:hypothetical protein
MGKGRELGKAERGHLRELATAAYERELSRELGELESAFRRWRGGEINAFDLSQAIHDFHQGASRDLFSKYAPANLEIVVAQAIHDGILSKDEAGSALLEYLADYLTLLKGR